MSDCIICDAKTTECIDCQDETLTVDEQQIVQQYALASISRDPAKRPEKNTMLETVIYWYQEALRPAPISVKTQSKSELIKALCAWRTA